MQWQRPADCVLYVIIFSYPARSSVRLSKSRAESAQLLAAQQAAMYAADIPIASTPPLSDDSIYQNENCRGKRFEKGLSK